jgi:hypothetical protein
MPDMLIKLFEIADDWRLLAEQKKRAITIRKPIGPEKHIIINWVSDHFGAGINPRPALSPLKKQR